MYLLRVNDVPGTVFHSMYLIAHSFLKATLRVNVAVFYHCPGSKCLQRQPHHRAESFGVVWVMWNMSHEYYKCWGPIDMTSARWLLGNSILAGCWGWAVFPGLQEGGWLVQHLRTGNTSHYNGSWRLHGTKSPYSFLVPAADGAHAGWWRLQDSGSLHGPPRSDPSVPGPIGLFLQATAMVKHTSTKSNFIGRFWRMNEIWALSPFVWCLACSKHSIHNNCYYIVVVNNSNGSNSNDDDNTNSGIWLSVTIFATQESLHSLQLRNLIQSVYMSAVKKLR